MALRLFAAARPLYTKVTVLGAAGGIGQTLSYGLKLHPRISHLTCVDLVNAPGVAKDLSHISTPAKCDGYASDQLDKALPGTDIVVIPAGVPRKPGMTRDDLFNFNAKTAYTLVEAIARHCPKAAICIITNPVNSTVPIAAEVLKKAGVYDPSKLFGVSTLDLVRAKTFIHDLKNKDFDVPVIGGHSGPTIIPVLSAIPGVTFTDEERAALTKRIQYAGDEVVEAKAGSGSATLSMAYAAVRFVDSLLRADAGENVSEWTYVNTKDAEPSLDFFATSVQLGKGFCWTKTNPVPELNDFEKKLWAECVATLQKDIAKGIEWTKSV